MIIQVSMVSWIIQIDAELADPTYALASIPPLFYALVTVRDRLLARATQFLAGGTPNDDMTVLAARRL